MEKIKSKLNQSGIVINFDEFKKVYNENYLLAIKSIIAKFELKYKTFKTYITTLKGYKTLRKNGNKYIIFPRFGFFQYFAKPKKIQGIFLSLSHFTIINKIQTATSPPLSLEWSGEFQDNQYLCFNKIMEMFSPANISAGKSGCILNLEAGQGKTFVAMGIIEELKTKTLIIVSTKSLLYQWQDLLNEYFTISNDIESAGSTTDSITNSIHPIHPIPPQPPQPHQPHQPNQPITGVYYGEKKIDGHIVIGVINSLLIGMESDSIFGMTSDAYFKQFGLVIVDECHEYCSKERGSIFNRIQVPCMLGLSATPNDRLDKFDQFVVWNMGDIIVSKDIPEYSEETIPFKGRVKVIKYFGDPKFVETVLTESDTINSAATINRIIEDPDRLNVIVTELQILIQKKYNTFIFSDRKDYLDRIKIRLNELNIENNIILTKEDENQVIKLVGGATSEDLDLAKAKACVILTTYQYAGTGLSIPKMNAIILATPRKSKSRQTINRIFRLGSNYDIERQIIDIVDWCSLYKHQWYKRKKYYQEKNYPIDEIIIQ